MSMVTSCPACATTYRVTSEQLRQRQGKVRCGQCRGVFDAFKTLATLADEPSAEPPEFAESRAPMAAGAVLAALPMQGSLDIDPASSANLHASGEQPPRLNRRARAAWGTLAALLLAALLGQLAYALRDSLAAALPASRPALQRMCAFAECVVAWPRRPDLLAIESSDLQADPERANRIVLTASLRNRGSVAVAHPALELTLTNAQDQMLARRIFLPPEYLPGPVDARAAMAAAAEVNVRLELDTGDLRPAGYRLFLFYP